MINKLFGGIDNNKKSQLKTGENNARNCQDVRLKNPLGTLSNEVGCTKQVTSIYENPIVGLMQKRDNGTSIVYADNLGITEWEVFTPVATDATHIALTGASYIYDDEIYVFVSQLDLVNLVYTKYEIQVIDFDNNLVRQWGTLGTGNGEFGDGSCRIWVDSDKVYVTDFTSQRIQKFDTDGTYDTQWAVFTGPIDGPSDVQVYDGEVYVSAFSAGDPNFYVYNTAGVEQRNWQTADFFSFHIVDDTIYGNIIGNTIYKYNLTGVSQGNFSSSIQTSGMLTSFNDTMYFGVSTSMGLMDRTTEKDITSYGSAGSYFDPKPNKFTNIYSVNTYLDNGITKLYISDAGSGVIRTRLYPRGY